ncbi:hypothetical protein BJ508DRAFT_324478 [Ascobolus immersus RN42]|uniref:Uncharacterized protein n=1 Tax=Ascobolus immersus RN42 TaxID=1160509 RepID=A0A3N4IBH8_ASCIM|nr:hypothetical protein BJ508DRAFT_324478 [Ascobolus immersus RN42]
MSFEPSEKAEFEQAIKLLDLVQVRVGGPGSGRGELHLRDFVDISDEYPELQQIITLPSLIHYLSTLRTLHDFDPRLLQPESYIPFIDSVSYYGSGTDIRRTNDYFRSSISIHNTLMPLFGPFEAFIGLTSYCLRFIKHCHELKGENESEQRMMETAEILINDQLGDTLMLLGQADLYGRCEAKLVRDTQLRLFGLVLDGIVRNIGIFLSEIFGMQAFGEDIAASQKRYLRMSSPTLRFLVNLRSESVESRIWKYLQEN